MYVVMTPKKPDGYGFRLRRQAVKYATQEREKGLVVDLYHVTGTKIERGFF